MWRSESVLAPLSFLAVSSAVIRSSITLPLDFDILVPSVPSTFVAVDSSASGSGKVAPYRSLKRRATTRVCSRCGSWSLPTGTTFALQNRMSAAWWTG
jgi:hypothetical protein